VIESHAPVYLRNVIRILTETGLRVYKELAPLRKDQVDLANKLVFIADSKTPIGVAEVPLKDIAAEAFQSPMEVAGPGPWLFPSSKSPTGFQTNFKKTWERTLREAGIPYFGLYDLRSHTLLDSVRVALWTNGSHSSFGRLMRRCSKSTPR
jgi:integrase